MDPESLPGEVAEQLSSSGCYQMARQVLRPTPPHLAPTRALWSRGRRRCTEQPPSHPRAPCAQAWCIAGSPSTPGANGMPEVSQLPGMSLFWKQFFQLQDGNRSHNTLQPETMQPNNKSVDLRPEDNRPFWPRWRTSLRSQTTSFLGTMPTSFQQTCSCLLDSAVSSAHRVGWTSMQQVRLSPGTGWGAVHPSHPKTQPEDAPPPPKATATSTT